MSRVVTESESQDKVILEAGKVKGVSPITCINLRLSHQILGCGDKGILPTYLWEHGEFCHTLIVSAPRCGKTTFTRTILSGRCPTDPSVSPGGQWELWMKDQRLQGCYQGIPQNNVGIRTDVLDGCPKAEG